MCWKWVDNATNELWEVSVAGFLGYDVLADLSTHQLVEIKVSVAGFLGYDVLELR